MDTKHKQPKGFFYAAWILLSTLVIPITLALTFAVLSLIIDQIGGFIFVSGQRRTTEDYLFLFIFVPLFCLLSSFLQYILLRRYLPKMGWWIVATGLGWVSVWAILQMLFSWFGSNFSITLGFSLIGTLIGFFQWLLLRRRIPQAAWWILANTFGWGLAALGMYTPVKNGSILAQLSLVGVFPALITGFAWWYIFRQSASSDTSGKAVA